MSLGRWDFLAIVFCILLTAYLLLNLVPGAFVTDEVAYLLTADSLYKTGWLDLWNGNNEFVSNEMELSATRYFEDGGVYGLMGIPAPFYAFAALPFQPFFGLSSIIALNILCYGLACLGVYLLGKLVLEDGKLAFLSMALFAFASYSLQYSAISIPHLPSIVLVLFSMLVFVYDYQRGCRREMYIYSGFMMGASLGFRYTNIVFLVILTLAVYHFKGVKRSLLFLFGNVIPLTLLFTIHRRYFLSWLSSGYGSLISDWLFGRGMIFAFLFGFAGVAAFLFRKRLEVRFGGFSRKDWWKFGVTGLVLLAFMVFFDPDAFSVLWMRAVYFYGKVFDMTPLAGEFGVFRKKAFFQATPYMILALAAPFIQQDLKRKRMLQTILVYASSILVFYSLVGATGGRDETFGMRYFLEAVPFFIVLSVESVKEYLKGLRGSGACVILLSTIFAAYLQYMRGWWVYPEQEYRFLHTLIAVLLLASFLLFRRNVKSSVLLAVFLMLSVSFSSACARADLNGLNQRKFIVSELWDGLDSVIEDDSVIVTQGHAHTIRVVGPKAVKTLRIVTPTRGNYTDTLRILEFYAGMNKTIYILKMDLEDDSDDEWLLRMREITSAVDYDRLYWMDVKTEVSYF
ncbi:MAG TPA: hypothetical protein ENN13_03380 [Candidatus Altiarchaeales archaeon]|nr:hypothetical protein [Candidatus Altiarchaeales archaeon]